jgi:hypothetical protein
MLCLSSRELIGSTLLALSTASEFNSHDTGENSISPAEYCFSSGNSFSGSSVFASLIVLDRVCHRAYSSINRR